MSNQSRHKRLARYERLLSHIHTAKKMDIGRQKAKKWALERQSHELDATDNSTDAIAYLDHRLAYRTALVLDVSDASEKIKLLETTAKTLEVARDKTRDTIVQLQYDIDAAEANELLQEFVAQSYVANKQAPDKS